MLLCVTAGDALAAEVKGRVITGVAEVRVERQHGFINFCRKQQHCRGGLLGGRREEAERRKTDVATEAWGGG